MVQRVFKRVEQKYIIDEKQYNILKKELLKYFKKDYYYKSKIYNIYFDNDNHDLLINSLEKPIYKTKLRLRSYGEVIDNDIVFLEIKEKYKKIVYKRRVKLTLNEYKDYLDKGIFPKDNRQIMKEIDYLIKYYGLKPYVFVGYDRLSYYAKEDNNLRITFDSNLRSRLDCLELKDNLNNKKYFSNNKYIMEVKSLNNLPLWFVSILSKNKIYPCSFSKVGSIYMKERG